MEKNRLSRRAGAVIPLFSVYSRQSAGIGELPDLKLAVDWCVKTGNSILQLLPLNAVGAFFCPYDSLSSFALEPAYLSLDALPHARGAFIKEKIAQLKMRFPCSSSHLDYRVKQEKTDILLELFFLSPGVSSEDFARFKRVNAYWLDDYALFMVLKGYQQYRPWYEWDAGYKEHSAAALGLFKSEHLQEIEFQMWMQWQLYRQFRDVKKYAAGSGVLVKGDLPILVSRDSADVWAHPEFFKLDFAAGAPPEMYAA